MSMIYDKNLLAVNVLKNTHSRSAIQVKNIYNNEVLIGQAPEWRCNPHFVTLMFSGSLLTKLFNLRTKFGKNEFMR